MMSFSLGGGGWRLVISHCIADDGRPCADVRGITVLLPDGFWLSLPNRLPTSVPEVSFCSLCFPTLGGPPVVSPKMTDPISEGLSTPPPLACAVQPTLGSDGIQPGMPPGAPDAPPAMPIRLERSSRSPLRIPSK